MRETRVLTVVKLGGSHAYSGHLRAWLAAIARGAGHVVLVPGGGPFADTVRAAQPIIGFDDHAAHHMALLAMNQYGCALASLEPCLVLAETMTAIHRGLADGKVPVWSPTRMALVARDIPASWDVTADSLAAWLAQRIGAKRLLLVKHVEPAVDRGGEVLAADGIFDPAFLGFVGAGGIEASIAAPAEHAAAAAAFERGAPVGRRIGLH
jgi:5-(aminomethyl)-3-furanmethanol phosphate kinase